MESSKNLNYQPPLAAREPNLFSDGFVVHHDMRCCVEPGEHAVYFSNEGVFLPSWKAQKQGWKLVHSKTRFQRWLLRTFFKEM